MAPSSNTASTRPAASNGTPELASRVCTLLEQAGAAPVRLSPTRGRAADAGIVVQEGWCLSGDPGDLRLHAAAELITLLTRSEREIESLCGEILERYEEASLIYRLAERLGDVTDEDAIAEFVLQNAARVLGARSGEVWLRKGPAVELAASVPADRTGDSIDQAGPLAALAEGRAWVQDPADGCEATAAVPLPTPGGSPIGAIVMRGRSDHRSYRTGEIKLLTALASVTSAFIRNARLAVKARTTDARRREDEIARQIHQGLLPHEEPDYPGLDIAAVCRAAERIGGDYYGYLEMPDGSLGVAMADISGHGVGAGLYMAAAKGALQAEARRVVSPSDLLRRANEALAADFSKFDIFATAFVARFAPGSRRFDYSNSGHHPPLFVRAGGEMERLDRGGLALGVLPSVIYQEESRCFDPGDVLVIYTDGLIEARNDGNEFYGRERLERITAGCVGMSAAQIRDCILADLARHTGGRPLNDDVTLVVVRGVEAEAGQAEVTRE